MRERAFVTSFTVIGVNVLDHFIDIRRPQVLEFLFFFIVAFPDVHPGWLITRNPDAPRIDGIPRIRVHEMKCPVERWNRILSVVTVLSGKYPIQGAFPGSV